MLSFFRAPPGYTVVFTANATGALKLVGEAFPFNESSSFVLGADSHNSVHGIRQFALRRGASINYIDSTDHGGLEVDDAKVRRLTVRSRVAPLTYHVKGYPPPQPAQEQTRCSFIIRAHWPIEHFQLKEPALLDQV